MQTTNEALIQTWIERVWNQKEEGAIAEYLVEETVAYGMGPNGTNLIGVEPFAQAHAQLVEAFPDIQITVEQMISQGDKVCCVLTCRGTHKGDSLGVAATGISVVFPAMTMARIENGKVLEGWNVIDLLAVFRQIGAMHVATELP